MKKSKGFMLFIACLGLVGMAGIAIASNTPKVTNNMLFAENQRISYYDYLTANLFKATNTTYKDFTNVGNYSGNSAKTSDGAIQLRSTSNSGIITTASPGKLKKVQVVWNAATSTTGNRQLDFYGKNTAYTSTSELYGNKDVQGTKLGSIVCGISTELVVENEYDYIGFRSKDGALYVDSITLYYNK